MAGRPQQAIHQSTFMNKENLFDLWMISWLKEEKVAQLNGVSWLMEFVEQMKLINERCPIQQAVRQGSHLPR